VTPRSIDNNEAGFTVLEVLVALALIVVAMVAIGSVMSTNARGVRSLEQHVALMQTTRGVMTGGIPARAELAPGISSGQTGDYHWTVEVAPLGGGWTSHGHPNWCGSGSNRRPAQWPISGPCV
jgi:general secretion pathway protein I